MNIDQGKSMAPLILPSDKIIVSKASSLKINDIVVFKKQERLIAHRLIYIAPAKDFLITKGDNNLKSDGKIKPDQILGKVESIKRDGEPISLSHLYLSQSSAYLKELAKLSKALNQKRLPYVILKGLPLHLHFGGSVPKRLYLDADILIKKAHLAKTNDALKKLGFIKREDILFDKKIKYPTQISYVKPTKPFPVIIDLHLEPAIGFTKIKKLNQLLPSTKTFTQHLFKNIQEIKVNSAGFPVLATETFVVYLLLHLYHHNFHGTHRLDFINNLVKNQKINWNKVISIVQRFKFRNLVFPAILILRRYYETPFPEDFIKAVMPSIEQGFVSQVIATFITPFNSGARAEEGVKRFIFLLFLSPSSIALKAKALLHEETRAYFLPTIKSLLLRVLTNSS